MAFSLVNLFNNRIFKLIVVALTGILLAFWLVYTPDGLLGKADAVGYSVCHRIPGRSFHIGERAVPLCARCSGMYLGALLGLAYQMRRPKFGKLPGLKVAIVLGIFFVAFGVDGLNSYLHFFKNAPHVYDPHNWLRLATGTGLGLGMAAVLLPTFNQALWKDWKDEAALSSWTDLAWLIGLAVVLNGIILIENPLILYPLALLSSAGVLLLLVMIYSVVWSYLTGKENAFTTLREAGWVLFLGFSTALLQIAVIDLGRFLFTGTWQGIIPLG